ncbi:hypothetical protein J5U46_02950 [Micromonospora tulbaghiae]|uniref:Uncharacterized protein n=1 Tax=Micromonospora tulbaghiae TaxID=479978 RepID=A0AAW4JCQ3_9ACTN|nr:hypothetical protein [Micromonospora tulbaghiae]MBO4139114.1 hypothetical protein [Micromonospora tulbaghiae]
MGVTWAQLLLLLLPVLAGAVIGIFPTLLLERMRIASALRTRWDQDLQRSCAEFAACTRRIIDLAEEPADNEDALEAEHRMLQVHMAEVRILGGFDVQAAARRIVASTHGLRMTASTKPEDAAQHRSRTLESLFAFYRAVRHQLRIPDADKLAPMNPGTAI